MSQNEMYSYVENEIEEAVEHELKNLKSNEIKKQDIVNIVCRVLARCGLEVNKKAGTVANKGLIDVYHRGLFIAAHEVDSDCVKLYPLRPGQEIEVLIDDAWKAVRVEENPAAQNDRAALRVRFNVADDVPIIGTFARLKREIAAPEKVAALPENVKEIEVNE